MNSSEIVKLAKEVVDDLIRLRQEHSDLLWALSAAIQGWEDEAGKEGQVAKGPVYDQVCALYASIRERSEQTPAKPRLNLRGVL